MYLLQILVQGMVPLCSAQYERVFNTTRIPRKEIGMLHKSISILEIFA